MVWIQITLLILGNQDSTAQQKDLETILELEQINHDSKI